MNQYLTITLIEISTLYFVFISVIYVLLLCLGYLGLRNFKRAKKKHDEGVTFVIPFYNEENLIIETIQRYQVIKSKKEIILVNDGSSDKSFELITHMFQMKKTSETIFESVLIEDLKLLHLPHQGKSQALNEGIKIAQHPIICTMDADTLPEGDSIEAAIDLIKSDKKIMAIGGIIHIIQEKGLLNILQRIEYLRTFMGERLGMGLLGATHIISGAFCMFRKIGHQRIGGFNPKSITEDLDFIMRLRNEFPGHSFPMIPLSTCRTQAPRTLKHLMMQRMRWHKGLIFGIKSHFTYFMTPYKSRFHTLGMWQLLLIEVLSPLMQLLMWITLPYALYQGWLSFTIVLLVLALALLLDILLTIIVIKLDPSKEKIPYLKGMMASLVLSLGYKQLTALWRIMASWEFFVSKKNWGQKPRYEIPESTL